MLHSLVADDEAVSSVIAVILLIAITVLLAAVIGMFVTGTGPSDPGPTAGFDFEYDDSSSTVVVTHSTGDKIDRDALNVEVSGAGLDETVPFTGGVGGSVSGSRVSTGDSVAIDASGATGGTADVRVFWEGDDTTATLDRGTVDI